MIGNPINVVENPGDNVSFLPGAEGTSLLPNKNGAQVVQAEMRNPHDLVPPDFNPSTLDHLRPTGTGINTSKNLGSYSGMTRIGYHPYAREACEGRKEHESKDEACTSFLNSRLQLTVV
jgi:hypothetical protein